MSFLASLAVSAVSFGAPLDAQAPPARPWTLLVYGAADNNADGPIQPFLDGVRKAIDDDAGIDVLLFLDRSAKWSNETSLVGEDFTGARLYRLTKDRAERLAGGAAFPEIALDHDVELDSADATTLRKFIAWGKATSPAKHYGVLVYSHASGEAMCPDEESAHSMGIAEVSAELTPAESVDFLALELCNMAGIEIAYEWRPEKDRFGADVLVAIPNEGPPLDWDRAFARIRSKGHASTAAEPFLDPATMSAADFGKLVIEEGERGRRAAEKAGEPMSHEVAACLDLRAAKNVKSAVDALAVLLWRHQLRERVRGIRDDERHASRLNYSNGGPYLDLYELALALQNIDDPPDVAFAAKSVCACVDNLVLASFGMDGYPGFKPGRNGVFIVLPVDKPGRWRFFKWYTPLAAPTKNAYGRWSFLEGGTPSNGVVESWFELLDAWYDEANDAGGVNGYRY